MAVAFNVSAPNVPFAKVTPPDEIVVLDAVKAFIATLEKILTVDRVAVPVTTIEVLPLSTYVKFVANKFKAVAPDSVTKEELKFIVLGFAPLLLNNPKAVNAKPLVLYEPDEISKSVGPKDVLSTNADV